MYQPADLSRFALSEFVRGLDGLSDGDARLRLTKADGGQTNAISWTAAHIGRHWLATAALAGGDAVAPELARYASGSTDPAPPPLAEALAVLEDAQASLVWVEKADAALMALQPGGTGDSIGTRLMRVTLHTWFHTGEINMIRQILSHAEIPFIGPMAGKLEWRP
jgi:hypothetical protein